MEKKYVRASNRKHHIVYKTTCIETNAFYIGMHSTDNLNDGYLGSGVRLRKSIRKYGEAAHKTEILFELENRQAASDKERELITAELRKDPKCMNCGPGGEGYYDRPATKEETSAKLSKASKQYVRTKEWYEKVVATRKANNSYTHTPEAREKIRASLTGKTLTEEHKKKISEGGTGQKRTEETCLNISKSLKGKKFKSGVDRKPVSEEAKENIRQDRIGKKHSEEAKSNMRKPHKKPKTRQCTVDGINIYQSVSQMVKALGSGQNSRRSPNFRCII
jgi:IS5 family transposase